MDQDIPYHVEDVSAKLSNKTYSIVNSDATVISLAAGL